MKKFFGLTILLVAALFVSCNFNNSNQKGQVNFSIPIAEIIALRNDAIAEESEEDFTEVDDDGVIVEENLMLYSFVVQIKGDGGFYAVKFEQLEDVNPDEMDDAKFHIYFDKLPANQKYKIMIDVYSDSILLDQDNPDAYEKALLVLSGEKENIVVSPGETTYVEMFLEHKYEYGYSDFDIILEYKNMDTGLIEKPTIEITEPDAIPVTFAQYEEIDEKTNAPTYTYYFKDRTYTEEDDDALYSGYKDQNRSEWTEFTKLYIKLKEKSHFWDFDFYQAIREYDEKTETETVNYVPLIFNDEGICDVTSLLGDEQFPFANPLSIQKKMNQSTIGCSGRLPIICLNSITFAEEPENNPTDDQEEDITNTDPDPNEGDDEQGSGDDDTTQTNIDEEIYGSLLISTSEEGSSGTSATQQLVFTERADSNRYIYDVSLKSVLNGKSLATGDTVVFVMKVASANSKPVTFSQFYYELRTENWEEMNDTDLYAGNECINVDNTSVPEEGFYTFVMPLNFIQNPKDYNTVLFFFDGQAGEAESSIALRVQSLDYYIFPAESKTFVFGLGMNYDEETKATYPYRYEFKKPLVNTQGTMYKFEGGETVRVALSGTVKAYKNIRGALTRTNFVSSNYFDGEIYDGANYKSNMYDRWQNFHPLSNTKAVSGNVTSLFVEGSSFTQSGTYVFVKIQPPFFDKDDSVETLPDHDYQFQCTSTCEDPSVLLAMEDFEIVTTVTESD